MADILKLKKKAADFEAKRQADKALATYREMIEVYEAGEEDPIDIPLYNRVGDLLHKAGNLPEAVAVWERAVDHYADGGFYNPAIALCNKILRQSPGRAVVYYKLGKISAEKGFKSDARQNFLEYASRMQKSGNLNEAFRALKEFADLVPDQDDVRVMLADQLVKADRKDEAVEQLQIAYAQLAAAGRERDAQALVDKMKAIDPSVEPRADSGASSSKGGGLVFLDVDGGTSTTRRSGRAGTPPAEVRRVTKAIEGLEILEMGMEAPPKAEPKGEPRRSTLTPPPLRQSESAPPAPAPPAPRAAAAPPPAKDLLVEPTHAAEPPAPPPRGSLLGLEATSFGDDHDPPASVIDDPAVVLPPRAPARATPAAQVPPPEIELVELMSETPPPVDDLPVLEEAGFGEQEAEEPVDAAALAEQVTADPPPETMYLDMEMSDFSSFGTAEPLTDPSSVPPGFDLLEIESSEGVHALPFSDPEVEAAPQSFESLELLDDEPAPPPRVSPAAVAPPAELAAEVEEPPPRDPTPRATSTVLASSVDLLRDQVVDAPDDAGLRRQYAEALLDDGQRDEGIAELELSLAAYEREGDLDTAASIAEEIVRLAPKVIRYHQKRVEFAFRANDRRRLAEAYVELADALLLDGQGPKARVVYQRVLEIAPDDLRAQAALETIIDAPVPEPAPAPRRSAAAAKHAPAPSPKTPARKKKPADEEEFVSLGDWLREEDAPKSTRMIVEEKEPTGDEQADFNDMLRKFKQGVADNVEDEDHEAHYDLGIAYKEMGLLDEAISEFQIALRGGENRARAYESLGHCFVEKGQLPVAATILQRALAEPGIGDDALVGVLYLLGAICEELGNYADAKKYYQRVFAVDIRFRDVGDRLNTVEQRLK